MDKKKKQQAATAETRKIRIAKALSKHGPTAINAMWRLMVLAAQGACWIVMPLAALLFAQWFTLGIDMESSGHGALAGIATYIVAGIAGIRGASQAADRIGEYKNINLGGEI